MFNTEPSHRRIAHRMARAGLLILLAALAGCNTLKGASKDIQKIGEGVQSGVEHVENEVSN